MALRGWTYDSSHSRSVRVPCRYDRRRARLRPGAAVGHPPAVLAATLDQAVPVDPLITVGTLPNGFRYYIRENRQPQARAELRLVVNAGSVLEDEDQRGLAHFVEHMAFNGTLNFPGNAVGSFMQSLGMRFGAHVNANTSFDETVYQLQIPTDNPAVIDRSLLILEDWAHNVSFDPREIDKERGVILEEWRLGLGAGERMQNAQFPSAVQGLALRGTAAHRQAGDHPERHSRPAEAVLHGLVPTRPDGGRRRRRFRQGRRSKPRSDRVSARSRRPPSPKPRPAYTVPDQPGTVYSVITDPEATTTRISVSSTMAARPQMVDWRVPAAHGRAAVQRHVVRAARRDRAGAERAVSPGADRPRTVRAHRRSDQPRRTRRDGQRRAGPGRALHRGRPCRPLRLHRDGAEPREAESPARAPASRSSRRTRAPRVRWPTNSCATSRRTEPIPGIVYEYGLNQRFMPEITLAEVNAVAKSWMPDRNRLVAIAAPEKDRPSLPTEARLAAVISCGSGARLTAYVDRTSTQPLLARLPSAGAIATQSTNETRWASPSGVCPTASGSCSSRRRSNRTRSCFGP